MYAPVPPRMTHVPSSVKTFGSAVSVSVMLALSVKVPSAPSNCAVRWVTPKVGAREALKTMRVLANVPESEKAPLAENVPGDGPNGYSVSIIIASR